MPQSHPENAMLTLFCRASIYLHWGGIDMRKGFEGWQTILKEPVNCFH